MKANTASFALDQLATGGSDAVAVVDGAVTTSYAALDEAVHQVAHGLHAAGLAEGDRVAFVGRNGLACVELLLGAARAGVVPTFLNWRLHPDELDFVLADSGAQLVVASEEFASTVASLPDARIDRLLVVGDSRGPDNWDEWRAGQSAAPAPVHQPPDDVALQLYTSGTTGRPKGAMLTRAGLAATIPDTAELWQCDASSTVLSVLPMFHIAGIGTVLATLWAGAQLVIDNDASPSAMRSTIERHHVTNLVLASVMLRGLLDLSAADGAGLSSLRTISYGAAPITEQTLHDAISAFGCRILQVYGLTETTGVLTALDDTDHHIVPGDQLAVERLRSCGRPRPGVEIRVVDPASSKPLPPGEVGEVQARTARLMRGYWQRPDATAEVLSSEGWFQTGDLGSIDDDGYLFLRDRLKDMIVSGGENIYPVEVEDALQMHPAVAEVAVVGVPDDRWGETPRAVVVPEVGSEVTKDELIEFARSRLARYKCPTSIDFVEVLPRNATGKVLRRELREPYWAGHDRRIG